MPHHILIDAKALFHLGTDGQVRLMQKGQADASERFNKVFKQLILNEGHSVSIFFLDESASGTGLTKDTVTTALLSVLDKKLKKGGQPFNVYTFKSGAPSRPRGGHRLSVPTHVQTENPTLVKLINILNQHANISHTMTQTHMVLGLDTLNDLGMVPVLINGQGTQLQALNEQRPTALRDKLGDHAKAVNFILPPKDQDVAQLPADWALRLITLHLPLPLSKDKQDYAKYYEKGGYHHLFQDYIAPDSIQIGKISFGFARKIQHPNRTPDTDRMAGEIRDCLSPLDAAVELIYAEKQEEAPVSLPTPRKHKKKGSRVEEAEPAPPQVKPELDAAPPTINRSIARKEQFVKDGINIEGHDDNKAFEYQRPSAPGTQPTASAPAPARAPRPTPAVSSDEAPPSPEPKQTPLKAEEKYTLEIELRIQQQMALERVVVDNLDFNACRMEHGLIERARWTMEQIRYKQRHEHLRLLAGAHVTSYDPHEAVKSKNLNDVFGL